MLNIVFVLVKPAVPANVGAAARAMKTMGFTEMRLVNPCDHLSPEARMLAHASNDILENATVFISLEEALEQMDFVIGTTSRRRTVRNKFLGAEELPEIILNKGEFIKNVAIVFGNEESGLSNSDADLCHVLATVSMATRYPSLNLAQAVMIFAYELSVLSGKKNKKSVAKLNHESWLVLRRRTELLLDNLNLREDRLIRVKLLERMALLEEQDIFLLHALVIKLLSESNR
ncbi:MAG: tRNA/rRNA methyltransferase [Bacteroidetes bacterium]|nr:tRNA/rRNA methyltransferase [Bacteroidota bacterium]